MPLRREPRLRQVQVQPAHAPRDREPRRRGGRGQCALHEPCYVSTAFSFQIASVLSLELTPVFLSCRM